MRTNEVLELLPEHFSDESKVWIFQSNRPFIEKEQKEIDEQLYQFYVQWLAHGDAVKGWAKLLFNQFVVVLADESGTNVSGCSTDSMVRISRAWSDNTMLTEKRRCYLSGRCSMPWRRDT